MQECVNDEVYDENKHNIIKLNETKLNDEDEDSTEFEDKEENATIDSEISTCAENDDKLNEIGEGKQIDDKRVGKDDASFE